MGKMTANDFVKSLKLANTNANLQEANKFELVEFPTTHFENSSGLERLKQLSPNQLIDKFNRKELDYQELILVLRYKLSNYVGTIPCILANREDTKKFLNKSARGLFSNKKKRTTEELLRYYNKVQLEITSNGSIKHTSLRGNTKDIFLDGRFKKFKSKIRDINRNWLKLNEEVKNNCEEVRKKWLNDILTQIKPELDLKNDNIHKKVTRIYDNCVAEDDIVIAGRTLNQISPVLNNLLKNEDGSFEFTFYTLKLWDSQQEVNDMLVPEKVGMCSVLYFAAPGEMEENIQKIKDNANGGLYLTKETQERIRTKLERYAQNPSEETVNKSEPAVGAKKRLSRRLSLSLKSAGKNIEHRLRRNSAPPGSLENFEAQDKLASRPQPDKLSGEEIANKSEPAVGAKKRLSQRLSLSLKSAGKNIKRGLRRDSAPPGSVENFEWQKSTLKKENVDKRKRRLFSNRTMKHHVSRLLKSGSSLSQEKLNEEVDKLAKNYSNDNKEQEYYKEKFTDLFMLNCFALDNKDELKEFFKLMKSAKKNPQVPLRLSPDTLDFYNHVVKAETFKKFVTYAFEKCYKRNGERKKPLSAKFKVSLLLAYCFDMETSLFPEKGAKNSEKITISLTGIAPVNDKTFKITIPENYEDLVQELMVKVKKRYDRSDSVLKPEIDRMLEQLERVLPKEVYDKKYDFEFIDEITGSAFLRSNQRDDVYRALKEMNGSDNYKKAFQEIKNEEDKTFIMSEERGNRYFLLNLIATVFVGYNMEGKYNELIKKMESDLSRAKGKAMIEERKRRGEKAREETQRKGISIGQRRKTPSPNGNSNATSQNKPPPEHLPPEVLEATKPSGKDSNTTSQNKPRSNVERLRRFFEDQSRSK